jgi:hypothetical protein
LALVGGKWVALRIPLPMNFYAKALEGHIDNPDAGWNGRGRMDAKGAGIIHALRRAEWSPSLAENGGNKRVRRAGRINRRRRSSIAP